MALNANVLSEKQYYVSTDKGRLYFNVFAIDVTLTESDDINIGGPEGWRTFFPYTTPVSVYSSQPGRLLTQFNAESGDYRLYTTKSSGDYISLYFSDGTNTQNNSLNILSNNCAVLPPVFEQSDGTWIVPTQSTITTINYTRTSTLYTANDADSFGLVSNPSLFTAAFGAPYFSIPSALFYGNVLKALSSGAPDLDPFSPGGTSEPGGGGGDFDDESDEVPDSPLPTLSAANTGFTRIYNPTLSQVQALAQYMWTDESFLTTIKNKLIQLLENPMDAIIAFNLLPCPIPDGGTQEFKVMYIPTGINMTVAAQQFVDLDCGTVQLNRYYGSALDQSPYTKVSIFLPYIGNVSLNTDEVMGATLQVKYRIDIVSGGCVAKVLVDGNVLYQFSGHCAITIPISSADFSRYVSAMINVAKVAIGAASGVPILPSAKEDTPMQLTGRTIEKTTERGASGRQVTTGTRTIEEWTAPHQEDQASFGDWAKQTAANTVSAVMGSKPEIEHAGSFSGNTGYLGVRRPYLIIERPRMCNPAEYGKYNGYPSMIHMSLGECYGYTEVQSVQLTGIPATNPELAEIGQLLKGGVIL